MRYRGCIPYLLFLQQGNPVARWYFHGVHGDDAPPYWYWQRREADVTVDSSGRFSTLEECMLDAIECGYEGSIPFVRDDHIEADQPRH